MKTLPKSYLKLLTIFSLATLFTTALISCEKEPVSTDEENNKPNNDLIAHWAFDENGVDSSGNGHTATLHDLTPTTDRFGKQKGAYYFNGINGYASVADNEALRLNNTDFTINVWVKLDSYQSSYASSILSKRIIGNNNGWLSCITGYSNNPSKVAYYGPGSDHKNAFGSKVLSLNEWHMITTVYHLSSGELSIYIDGVLDNTTSEILTANGTINAMLYIGKDEHTNNYYLKGALDDISIYGRVQSSAEILQFYETTKGASNNLVAYWPFDGNGDDASGNTNTASLNNLTSTFDRFCNPNGALYFNGINSFATVADNVALRLNNTNFTLNAWVKTEKYDPSYGSALLSKHITGANNGWTWSICGYLSPFTGPLFYGPGGGSNNAVGTTIITLNKWHMVTSVYNNANQTLTMYVDGEFNNATNSILTPNPKIEELLYIGKDKSTNLYYYKGALDDIRIYDRILSAEEIKQSYNNSSTICSESGE